MEKEIQPIDFGRMAKKLWKRKVLFFKTLPVAFILSSLYIICFPRYYQCDVKLAPEIIGGSNSTLSSLASSFGIDMAGKLSKSIDAISPELYPDLMSSVDFRVSMFNIPVTTKDKSLTTTYYNYLLAHQKSPWWSPIFNTIRQWFVSSEDEGGNIRPDRVNPFQLTKKQDDIAGLIGKNISCKVDKKTNVITITAIDQDPYIAATLADSAKARLQYFITEYRTKKAKNDVAYTKKLLAEAKKAYVKARQRYGLYDDANTDVVLKSYQLRQEDLENEMQLQYNNYAAIANQLHSAEARVQEQTPAFTTLQSATVPRLPAGPKRVIFVLAVCAITFLATSLYIIQKEEA